MIYRIIVPVQSETHPFASGATYPGCNRLENPTACGPISFQTLDHAIVYALNHGETPILAATLDEVDAIIAGDLTPSEDMILAHPSPADGLITSLSLPVIAGIVLLGVFLLGRNRKTA